jgi:hypothetical protein
MVDRAELGRIPGPFELVIAGLDPAIHQNDGDYL